MGRKKLVERVEKRWKMKRDLPRSRLLCITIHILQPADYKTRHSTRWQTTKWQTFNIFKGNDGKKKR